MPNIRVVIIFAIVIFAAAAGLAYPYISTAKPIYLAPMHASQWHMGKGSQYNPDMNYQITLNKTKFSADLQFVTLSNNTKIVVKIVPGDGTPQINQTVDVNMVYAFPNVSPQAKPYFDILDQTVFTMRDYATEDKYLAKDAEWGDLYIGANHEKLKVTAAEDTNFGFGSAKAYILSYRIGAHMNKIWIVDNLPVPAKAEIYDPNGNLQYSYELVSLRAPQTPGLTS